MTQLILMRHAQAKSAAPSDFSRELNAEGILQAKQAGDWLRKNDYVPDLAIVSSAARTGETFEYLKLKCEVNFTDEAYNASSGALIELLKLAPDACERILLLAHNPGVSDIAFALGHRRALSPGSLVLAQWNGAARNFGISIISIVDTFTPSDN